MDQPRKPRGASGITIGVILKELHEEVKTKPFRFTPPTFYRWQRQGKFAGYEPIRENNRETRYYSREGAEAIKQIIKKARNVV